ncbi:MAG TPA: galactose-1-epimerase [Porphyromonadaceae bacterium]|nr:galactose-1-epimerase [Porphyromonadaceae bacterium]
MENSNTLSGLQTAKFETTVDGKKTQLFVLTNENGCEMTVTNYGAKIASLMVPDKNGKLIDVVTGHDSIEDYLTSEEPYFGAICGRYGNRIAKGTFTIDGNTYNNLAINNGPNSLHGGIKGFNAVVWTPKNNTSDSIELEYMSADGEEGFPGNLTTIVTYTLTNSNEVVIDYKATTDKPTVLNLTNHSYFNLSGEGNDTINDHILEINASTYLPTDNTAIPYGAPEKLEGTPMDFKAPELVGKRINENFEQLIFGKGYDHTYIIDKPLNEYGFCAKLTSPISGIVMETYTTEPGVQLYTGNWMTGNLRGKHDHRYPMRSALCLETQHYPDSPNKPEYPSTELRPGEVYTSKTVYKFTTK